MKQPNTDAANDQEGCCHHFCQGTAAMTLTYPSYLSSYFFYGISDIL